MSIRDALGKLVLGQDLSRAEANAAMTSLVEGDATPAQIAGFAIALRMKGETPEEIAGLAEAMRAGPTPVDAGGECGVGQVFTIRGPLTNPAGARRQLTGVAVPSLGETLAQVLALLGAEHAMVVHGQDGLDEISVCAPTEIHEARNGQVRSYTIEPEQFGIQRWTTDALRGGTVEANVRLANGVLAGDRGPARDVVLLNA